MHKNIRMQHSSYDEWFIEQVAESAYTSRPARGGTTVQDQDERLEKKSEAFKVSKNESVLFVQTTPGTELKGFWTP